MAKRAHSKTRSTAESGLSAEHFGEGRRRQFIYDDGYCKERPSVEKNSVARESGRCAPNFGDLFSTINPATGEVLGELRVDGPAEVDAAVLRRAVHSLLGEL